MGFRSSLSEAVAEVCDADLCSSGKKEQWTDGRYILEIELTASGIQRSAVS
jgi:hypothetical protein